MKFLTRGCAGPVDPQPRNIEGKARCRLQECRLCSTYHENLMVNGRGNLDGFLPEIEFFCFVMKRNFGEIGISLR
jgi:hypothetical protein